MSGIALKAGNLDLLYQNGFIRYIKLGDLEILRMINHAVRDQNWGTVPMQITDEKIEHENQGFQINYSASFIKDSVDFELQCKIIGRYHGSIDFIYEGVARKNFKRNRIGFTVLHPIESCKGNKVNITHSNGSETESKFPIQIAPNQPFKNIRKMDWSPSTGINASLLFEGDIFETEDQRNWTDASYKTYCTPLELPFPVDVSKDDLIQQRVTLKVNENNGIGRKRNESSLITMSVSDEEFDLPEIGIVLNNGSNIALQRPIINDISPDYWRVEMNLDREINDTLKLLVSANLTEIPVELSVFSDQKDPIDELKKLKKYFESVKRVLLFGESSKTTQRNWLKAVPKIKELLPDAEIFAGTDAFFTELNRDPVEADNLDGVTYSINPQVHAFDNQSVIETLEAQGETVQNAQKIFPGKKISISPVSWHMRWNPNATDSGEKLREPTGLSDERLYTFFGACWFLISFKYLAESGAVSVAYFELAGENGWVKEVGDQLMKSPVYALRNVLKDYDKISPIQSSHPLYVDAICLKKKDREDLYLVNWTDQRQLITINKKFEPVCYWNRWDALKFEIIWEGSSSGGKLGSYELKPNSITQFEGVSSKKYL